MDDLRSLPSGFLGPQGSFEHFLNLQLIRS